MDFQYEINAKEKGYKAKAISDRFGMILPFIVFQIAPDTGLIQFACYDAFAMGICAAFSIFSMKIP